jgi:DNA-directed RNA polymerase specialized sigma54-like protein
LGRRLVVVDDDDDGFYPQQVATNSLRDHLLSQLAVLNLPLRDRQLVASLIDALDEDGYLHVSLEEIAEMFPPSSRSIRTSSRSRFAICKASSRRASAPATLPNASRCS